MSRGLVAVDLGASSARFAAGALVDGRIQYEVVEQVQHHVRELGDHEVWDLEALQGICKRAWDHAEMHFESASVGIDSWGVDHGFLRPDGTVLAPPVAYRDRSHQVQFDAMAAHRSRLYALTGIQHQPFNTIYQLAARMQEGVPPAKWLLMPDLMGYLLTGVEHCESTMASTTQLVTLDGRWCAQAFDLANWPVPDWPISPPGRVLAERGSTAWVSVGSHDTASAVFGLGSLEAGQAFLNVGTWSLLGVLSDTPILSSERFTNERAVDGRIRYLTNIPGFYVTNRVFDELDLGPDVSVGSWLSSARPGSSRHPRDLTAPEFFNPKSMKAALAADGEVATPSDWASLVLDSMVKTTKRELQGLEAILGRRFTSIRISGGGSRSMIFCQALANGLGVPVIAGPEEATLLGNMGAQLVATGEVESFDAASAVIDRSFQTVTYVPS